MSDKIWIFDQKSLVIFGVYLGYRALKGFIIGWREGSVSSDTSGSQELKPIDGEILPPLRERHVLRRIEKDVL